MSKLFKKCVSIFFVWIIVISAVGCSSDNKPTGNIAEQNHTTDATASTEENNTEKQEPTEEKEWGVRTALAAAVGGDASTFYISYPTHTGVSKGTGWVGAQDQPILVIVDRQDKYSPEVDTLNNIFPAYFEQTTLTLGDYLGSRGRNIQFSVTDSEMLTVGSYDMLKVYGACDYEYEREPIHQEFVAYATQLKENGAVIYWMLLDCSEDHEMMDLTEEWAYNMALSLAEP